MKRIMKVSNLFKKQENKKAYDRILESLEATKKVQSELDKILDALDLEETFPTKKAKKIDDIVSNLKKGDIVIKRGSKNIGEVLEINADSLIVKIGGKKVKCWRQELKKVI